MAKDGYHGLIGKVVRLVLPGGGPRSTLAGASGPSEGETESEVEGGKGRQLLRELMERRRRNDLVRQREFDQLRRMRRLVAASSPGPSDGGVDSESVEITGFEDTALDSNSEERAVTLRKIDEIEEQMSRQWWKTRPADPVDLPPEVVAEGDSRRLRDAAASRHQPLAPEAVLDFGPQVPRPPTSFAPTAYEGSGVPPPRMPRPPRAIQPPLRPAALVPDFELPDLELPDLELPDAALAQLVSTGPGPMPGPLPALPGFVHDPALEEAAIEFANADVDAAQHSLRGLIDAASARGESEEAVRELWFTLFDLYRALGRREPFEAAAIAYAERWGRSPPAWVSLAADIAPLPAGTGDYYWRCPALVAAHTVARLRSGAEAATGAWWLDWSGLEGFEHDAVAPLLATFIAWSEQPAQIYFEGAERLLAALEARTLTGAADAEAAWWRLRMEALRLLRRMDEYEEAALDYCITYEVSPPSWQEPACDCRALQIGSHAASAADADLLAETDSSYPQGPAPDAAALVGEIGTDVGDVLARLDTAFALQAQNAMPGRDELLVIDCARLVRLDFVAAGSVLGWAASRHGEGMAVEFRNLHRLVGTFFNVTGISEYARVYVRPD